MYCPKCGKGEQQAESYCRKCGEYLIDYTRRSFLLSKLLGVAMPTTQIYLNLALNLITIFTSFLLIGFLNGYYDALEERTGEGAPNVIYLVYAFLVGISLWQFLSIIVSVRLKSKLGRKKSAMDSVRSENTPENFPAEETQKILMHPVTADTTPLSVTEDSTRMLNTLNNKERR